MLILGQNSPTYIHLVYPHCLMYATQVKQEYCHFIPIKVIMFGKKLCEIGID